MATIRTTRETTVRLNSRIENLERAERAKSAKIESQSRQISELERVLATKVTALEERDGELAARTDELSEKNDALVATCQQLEEMTDNCESLEQQLRERPATPMSSNRSRPQPHSLLPTTFQMPDDLVDHEQEGEQDVQDQQTEQEGYQEHQPDDQLSGPVSSDSSTSQGEEDETPIVRRDLEQLEVGLTIVVQNSEGRLVYQGCPGGLLKSIILRQLAEFRAAYGDGYVGHFSGSHRCVRYPISSSGCLQTKFFETDIDTCPMTRGRVGLSICHEQNPSGSQRWALPQAGLASLSFQRRSKLKRLHSQ